GASGLDSKSGADTRVAQALQLPNGPFPLRGPKLPYDSYTGDTIHRFFQMWQQSDCSAAQASKANPSGCLSDLYAFVAVSASARNQGGGTASAFYNVNDGAAPYLKRLADDYTMSDNYHQAQMGGTMVEHFFLMAADDLFYSDGHGTPASPPPAMIADPDPRPGTPNRYRLDGWYSKCADPSQPGVGAIVAYLKSLQPPIDPNCAAGHYYAINNLFPAYNADGTPSTSRYAVPPSGLRTIGEALSEKGVSWRYYGGMFDRAVAGRPNRYCALCNSFQFSASIMGNQAARAEHLKDVQDLYGDIARGSLPAVAYVKPDEILDGHPASSKVVLFEAFTRRIVETLQANPALFARSAVFVTFDEGGGYYDSGYIQPLDFQGDGPRIPFIVVSPFAKGGRVVHSYCDHASVVKFIERNWRLAPLSKRSRDNLPNPVAEPDNPYVPVNRPAICDLFDMFEF
ncbi:MAG TPA: alkaline phosphatase family protein, partial [Alphaproteobacteria bacterium]|nr:alkaline phosphatase family protein [Alphaproteobacteria bacterium]